MGSGKYNDKKNKRGHLKKHNGKSLNSYDQSYKQNPAIKAYKSNQPDCSICQKKIQDLSVALAHRTTGEPIHFDCALEELKKIETLEKNQKIIYIGQGRFAVATFPNTGDLKAFSITRIIDWEIKGDTYEWRADIAELYSKVQ